MLAACGPKAGGESSNQAVDSKAVVAPAVDGRTALASWKDTPDRQRIIAFVESVTAQGAATFVPEAERIAVFDNDGTLWSEQPLHFQGFFALDRVHKLAASHPEWNSTEPYKSALSGDMKGLYVLVEEVRNGDWAIGGKTVTPEDVKKVAAGR